MHFKSIVTLALSATMTLSVVPVLAFANGLSEDQDPFHPIAPLVQATAVANGFEYRLFGDRAMITGYQGSDDTVVIPAQLAGHTVNMVGEEAFEENWRITSVSFEANSAVTAIGENAFEECMALTSVSFPLSLQTIGDSAFEGCRALRGDLVLPNAVTRIGEEAFANCPSLSSVTIPASVNTIGEDAFENCSPSFVIVGSEGSTAQRYANANGIAFRFVSSDPSNSQTDQNQSQTGFSDVPVNAWYADAVKFVDAHGIMTGYGNGQFGPMADMTRAQMAVVMWRLDEPEDAERYQQNVATNRTRFLDVADHEFYTGAVNWAVQEGIMLGYAGGNTFGPNDPLTFEQMITIIARSEEDYIDLNRVDTSVLNQFKDASSVSSYAQPAMAWAVSRHLVNGSDGYLYPSTTVHRARAAAVFYNGYSQGILD